MIPVEIRLKDFEAYIKNARSFLRAIRILNISSLSLIVVSALFTTYLVIGVVSEKESKRYEIEYISIMI